MSEHVDHLDEVIGKRAASPFEARLGRDCPARVSAEVAFAAIGILGQPVAKAAVVLCVHPGVADEATFKARAIDLRAREPDQLVTAIGREAIGLVVDRQAPRSGFIDDAGNIFISDANNSRIRKVCGGSGGCVAGQISTVAGSATRGFAGDEGLATDAQLNWPRGIASDRVGNLIIADTQNRRVRRVCGTAASCTAGTISTVVGNGVAQYPGPATAARLDEAFGLFVDANDNIYFTHLASHRVRKVCGDGVGCVRGHISELAGDGSDGFSGDGGPATVAQLKNPAAVAADSSGNIFIADGGNHRIRRVCGDGVGCIVGTISTFAGTGTAGFLGDGGPATSAQLTSPDGVFVDAGDNVLIADYGNFRVRKVCGDGEGCVVGNIYTVAGTGVAGSSGDGGPATSAQVRPSSVCVDGAGNLYVAEAFNNRVRKICGDGVDCVVGTINTIAGDGTEDFLGDDVPAAGAPINHAGGVAVDATGNVYIADTWNVRIRKVCVDGVGCVIGNIYTVAGNGSYGTLGDGGPATSAELRDPHMVAIDSAGNILIADTWSNRIRKVCADGVGCVVGHITTVAGEVDPAGEGALSRSRLGAPYALVPMEATWLIADGASGRVRSVNLSVAVVSTVAGYPRGCYTEACGADYSRLLADPRGIAFDAASRRLFVSEFAGHTVRAIDTAASPWTVTTSVGVLPRPACCAHDWSTSCSAEELADPLCADDSPGFAEGSGTTARLSNPAGLLFDATTRRLLVADAGNHVLRAINVDTGASSIVAGTARSRGFYGEGVPALAALLNEPQAMTLGNDGALYVADTGNNRIRRIDAAGVITTVLGDGSSASSGEGAPAALFPVDRPLGLALDAWGNLFVSSSSALRVVFAGPDNMATGEDRVETIYGRPPRQRFPEPVTSCLSGIAVVVGATGAPQGRLLVLDACAGFLLQLDRVRL